MKAIPFFKMSGSGNDFIIIDHRTPVISDGDLQALVTGACRRKRSVGADGLILVEPSRRVDFAWRFFNADGSRPEMCGNGARCAARFALLNGIAGPRMAFETLAGVIEAEVGQGRVKIRMTDPGEMRTGLDLKVDGRTLSLGWIDTGVPHAVVRVEAVEAVDVVGLGRRLRHHAAFGPGGTNVNFVAVDPAGRIFLRTYERGVEDETLACGTGAVAVALMLARERGLASPVTLIPRGQVPLTVYFERHGAGFRQVFLEGDARVIYRGELWEEAWRS